MPKLTKQDELKLKIDELNAKFKEAQAQLRDRNRELEIEAALEKVRAIAMSMKDPVDMLDVCKTISLQLQALGVTEIRNVQTAIFYQQRGIYMNYQYYARHYKTFITETIYTDHKVAKDFAAKMLKGKDEIYITHIKGKKVKDWLAYQKTTNVFIDRFLEKASSLSYYWHSLGPVALGISTYVPLNKEDLNLFNRFLKVFELAYTRYLDIEQAIAQAKEAKIELALERVRVRAMSMQHSDELAELVATVFKELTQLDFSLTSCIIWIHNHEHTNDTLWISSAEMSKPAHPFRVQPFYDAFFKSIIHAWKAKDPKWIFTLTGVEKKNFEKAFFKELPNLPDALRKALKEPKQVVFSASFNNFGALEIVETEPLTDEKFDILHRFGKVFDSSYTRFNDLKKAEAQSREAQIELGLERVRARAMAMQKSDELSELVDTVFKELTKLDFALTWCIINIIDERSLINTVWAANPDIDKAPESYYLKFEDYPFHHAMMEGWKERKTIYVYVLEGLEKKVYDEYLFNETEFRRVPAAAQAASRAMEKYVVTFSFSNFGGLQTVGNVPLSDANLGILSRFGKVFDLTYTRFNDLKLAEAQAREAQIEAALERVRSRTMGMQKSEELKEVIQVVYEQFVHLNIKIEHTGFVIDYKARDDYDIWIADPLGVPSQVTVPYFDSVYYNRFNEAKKNGEDFFATNLSFEEKNRFYQKLFEYVPGLPEQAKEFYFSCPGLAASTVLLENISLYIENFSGIPYTDEENAILMRFGKVFEQAYIRFNDLKQAEAQAREARIEAALERTRTQSMIMQHSNELDDSLRVFHQQVLLLGIDSAFSFLWLPDEDKDRHIFWAAWAENNPTVFRSKAINYPLDRNEPATAQCLADWKSNEPVYSYHVPPAAVENYFAVWNELIAGVEQLKPEYFKGGLYYVEAFMKYGCFGVMVKNELKEDEKKILARFAIEFERTYTRFLDLQKAEAQAREAKIEAALEKVRSRTMAMQRSTELRDAAALLFQQAQALGVSSFACGFNIWDDDRKAATAWMAQESVMQPPFKTPSTEDVFLHIHDAAQRGESLFVVEQAGKDLEAHYKYMATIPIFRDIMEKMSQAGLSVPTFQIIHCAFFSQGYLMFISYESAPEAYDIFKRFAKVFEQTYTRFLDLQKAETQAKESELEKKRSEELLLNILPREIANELKQFGKSYARKHEQVSILFTDIKGFSTISENLSAEELVNQLDECFRAFDHIVGKHGLEKIKTVGDAYICACGLPNPDPDNAVKTVRAAIDMLDFAKGFGMTKIIQDLPAFEFRVGIHTGPVITGVVGLKKFTYDIWGDAVNMAARMEQHGEAGKINISGSTYQLIKDKFICSHRGKILAKNKGEVDMYFVEKKND
jgi:class 3 adenylate cyclase/DNA-directed RNA polymerase subunit N (RpoN/RPB10)